MAAPSTVHRGHSRAYRSAPAVSLKCGCSAWLNRIEAQFTALRCFTLDGTDRAGHKEQGSMIRRYIIWCNHHADDRRLRAVVDRANVA